MSLIALLILSVLIPLDNNDDREIDLVGVYQGVSLFIQNPYQSETEDFCVSDIYVNNRRLDINYKSSALILDFKDQELYTPVAIRIVPKDTICQPVILNPDAILFHTTFKFTSINLSDSALSWDTEGERGDGEYFIEKLVDSFWKPVKRLKAEGAFETASYSIEPALIEGANKYRVKYSFRNRWYLYSQEADYDYYPDPVQFSPYRSSTLLTLSRFSPYEIYDEKSELVLSGSGSEIDISTLPVGKYVIFFDGKDPGSFTRIRK